MESKNYWGFRNPLMGGWVGGQFYSQTEDNEEESLELAVYSGLIQVCHSL